MKSGIYNETPGNETQYDHTVLLAHGSRDPLWSKPFRDMHNRLSLKTDNVSLAFMELCEPDLATCVKKAAESGAAHIAVLPLFFASGRHLREDVPTQIAQITATTSASVTLLPAIGEQELFVEFLEKLVFNLIARTEGV